MKKTIITLCVLVTAATAVAYIQTSNKDKLTIETVNSINATVITEPQNNEASAALSTPINEKETSEAEQLTQLDPIDKRKANETLFTMVERGDFSKLEEFHSVNLLCSSTKGYATKEEYLAELNTQSNLDYERGEYIYESCKGLALKSFKELESLYLSAITTGTKEAEFILAVTYPPNFRNNYYWLSKAATWKPEALDLLLSSVATHSKVTEDQKLFWALIQQDSSQHINRHLIASIPDYESAITEERRLAIHQLHEKWSNAQNESERRQILDLLESD